ncbi:response regulator [Roseateles chitinivorans]|uniref:response regulator n=1 Tax=Roseateles chitinivorans TaxID=2917965 RepID=UPI003D673FA3
MRILLIDASSSFRRRLHDRLTRVPGAAVVGQAEHEDQAVMAAGLCRPDVILTDLTLSTGTGFSAVERLRASGFQGTAYAVTCEDESVFGPLCIAAGIDGFYDKIHDLDRLVQALVVIADAPTPPTRSTLKIAEL